MNCPRTGCKNQAITHPQYGTLPCKSCQDKDANIRRPNTPEFYSETKVQRVQSQRDTHYKDIIQPYDHKGPNPEFIRSYDKKTVKEFFSDKEIAKNWDR